MTNNLFVLLEWYVVGYRYGLLKWSPKFVAYFLQIQLHFEETSIW
jgi:hypothetical protein